MKENKFLILEHYGIKENFSSTEIIFKAVMRSILIVRLHLAKKQNMNEGRNAFFLKIYQHYFV